MYCLQHLIRNVCYKFSGELNGGELNDKQLQQCHNDMAESATMESFFKSFLHFIESIFKNGVNIKIIVDIAFYVLRVHPSHWTIFGNSPWFSHHSYLNRAREVLRQITLARDLSDKLQSRKSPPPLDRLVEMIDECKSKEDERGKTATFVPNKSFVNFRSCPRYGNTRNNVSESLANTFITVGVREDIPPVSILSCIELYNKQLKTLFKDVKKNGDSFSSNGNTIWKQELDQQQVVSERLFLYVYSLKEKENVDEALCIIDNSPPPVHSLEEKENVDKAFYTIDNSPPDQGKDNISLDVKDVDNPSHPRLSFKFHNERKELYCMSLSGSPVTKETATTQSEQINTCHPSKPSAAGIWQDGNLVNSEKLFIDFTKKPNNEEQQKIEHFLGKRQTKQIMLNVSGGKDILISHLSKISRKEWFTDEEIDLYFWALNAREREIRREKPKCYFFPVFFFSFVIREERYNYNEAVEFTKDIDVFSYEKLFIVINKNTNHWVCMVVHIKDCKIVIHDSMNTHKFEHELLLMFRFLSDVHCTKKGTPLLGEWTLEFPDNQFNPQKDGNNCGCFVCMFANCLSQDLKPNFNQAHSDNF